MATQWLGAQGLQRHLRHRTIQPCGASGGLFLVPQEGSRKNGPEVGKGGRPELGPIQRPRARLWSKMGPTGTVRRHGAEFGVRRCRGSSTSEPFSGRVRRMFARPLDTTSPERAPRRALIEPSAQMPTAQQAVRPLKWESRALAPPRAGTRPPPSAHFGPSHGVRLSSAGVSSPGPLQRLKALSSESKNPGQENFPEARENFSFTSGGPPRTAATAGDPGELQCGPELAPGLLKSCS